MLLTMWCSCTCVTGQKGFRNCFYMPECLGCCCGVNVVSWTSRKDRLIELSCNKEVTHMRKFWPQRCLSVSVHSADEDLCGWCIVIFRTFGVFYQSMNGLLILSSSTMGCLPTWCVCEPLWVCLMMPDFSSFFSKCTVPFAALMWGLLVLQPSCEGSWFCSPHVRAPGSAALMYPLAFLDIPSCVFLLSIISAHRSRGQECQ